MSKANELISILIKIKRDMPISTDLYERKKKEIREKVKEQHSTQVEKMMELIFTYLEKDLVKQE